MACVPSGPHVYYFVCSVYAIVNIQHTYYTTQRGLDGILQRALKGWISPRGQFEDTDVFSNTPSRINVYIEYYVLYVN